MQLADYHAFGTIDDECALWCHQWDFTHVHLLFLGAFFFAQLECNVQWRAVGLSFPLRFERRQFWLADIVVTEIKNCFLIVALDRKNFLENSLQPLILSL